MKRTSSLGRSFGLGVLIISLVACGSSDDASTDGPGGPIDDPTPVETVSLDLTGTVRGVSGGLLAGALLSMPGDSGTTGRDGRANLSGEIPANAEEVVVKAELEGHVPQSLRVPVAGLDTVQLVLQPVEKSIALQDISTAQTVAAASLNASVSFAENSFVLAGTSTLATGKARVELTPWNIQDVDLLAMPGGGQAIAADGDRTLLISAGMMTVNFFNDAGQPLQLAEGKTADIQMDLPIVSIDGQAMEVGTEIPMWSFDPDLGLWVEDGVGEVVESPASPTGLAVLATVSHFSTWNWDFKWSGGSTLNVRCVDGLGHGVACSVVVDVTLPDGSKVTPFGGNTGYLAAEGTQIINMPNQATIHWYATTATGMIGERTSGIEPYVEIEIENPKTSNFVRCLTELGAPIACEVTLSATVNGDLEELMLQIPADGATVQTMWDVTNLSWAAKTPMVGSAGQRVRYEGAANSGSNEDVVIGLSSTLLGDAAQALRIRCDGVVYSDDSVDGSYQPLPVEGYVACFVRISIMSSQTGWWSDVYVNEGLPANIIVTVPLPDNYVVEDELEVFADSYTDTSGYLTDRVTKPVIEVEDGELIDLRLVETVLQM
ncbi:MAG: FAM171 family protein [Marinobacter sp.]|nr:FAM171 family protein [Marinobacter sp.]